MVARDTIAVYAVPHGISKDDDKFIIGLYTQDTNVHITLFRIEGCSRVTQIVRDFVENKAYELGYNVVEWR